jgi:hypothetical protein
MCGERNVHDVTANSDDSVALYLEKKKKGTPSDLHVK